DVDVGGGLPGAHVGDDRLGLARSDGGGGGGRGPDPEPGAGTPAQGNGELSSEPVADAAPEGGKPEVGRRRLAGHEDELFAAGVAGAQGDGKGPVSAGAAQVRAMREERAGRVEDGHEGVLRAVEGSLGRGGALAETAGRREVRRLRGPG